MTGTGDQQNAGNYQQLEAELAQTRKALMEREDQLKRLSTASQMASKVPRLEQELAIVAQRLDVDEELDRIDTHVTEVKRTLETEKSAGRRLDFLMQELNREANTLASKSVSSECTQSAVELKVLIEQMREQIQNIE